MIIITIVIYWLFSIGILLFIRLPCCQDQKGLGWLLPTLCAKGLSMDTFSTAQRLLEEPDTFLVAHRSPGL